MTTELDKKAEAYVIMKYGSIDNDGTDDAVLDFKAGYAEGREASKQELLAALEELEKLVPSSQEQLIFQFKQIVRLQNKSMEEG